MADVAVSSSTGDCSTKGRDGCCQLLTPRPAETSKDAGEITFVHCGLGQTSQHMLNQQLFTDATLVVQGHSIPVHRAVLAANSPVFYRMFTCQMSEGKLSMPDIGSVFCTSCSQTPRLWCKPTATQCIGQFWRPTALSSTACSPAKCLKVNIARPI